MARTASEIHDLRGALDAPLATRSVPGSDPALKYSP